MTTQIQAEIRHAFAAGDFVRAGRLCADYAGQVREAIAARTATRSTLEEMGGLIEEARAAVRMFRIRAADRIQSAHAAAAYAGSAASEASPAGR